MRTMRKINKPIKFFGLSSGQFAVFMLVAFPDAGMHAKTMFFTSLPKHLIMAFAVPLPCMPVRL